MSVAALADMGMLVTAMVPRRCSEPGMAMGEVAPAPGDRRSGAAAAAAAAAAAMSPPALLSPAPNDLRRAASVPVRSAVTASSAAASASVATIDARAFPLAPGPPARAGLGLNSHACG